MNNKARLCNIVSIFLLVCFVIKTLVDYSGYNKTLTSAPFYVWVLMNIVYFVVPAIVIWMIGKYKRLK